jgi:hypothetical protein
MPIASGEIDPSTVCTCPASDGAMRALLSSFGTGLDVALTVCRNAGAVNGVAARDAPPPHPHSEEGLRRS